MRIAMDHGAICALGAALLWFAVGFGGSVAADDDDIFSNHSCYAHRPPLVELTRHCSHELNLTSPIRLIPRKHPYYVFENCLNCSVTFRTSFDELIVATVYTLGTETGDVGNCTLNRLDIYDGEDMEPGQLISGEHGLCGDKVPGGGEFKSSSNLMTIHFQTDCNTSKTQHGQLELVLITVPNEQTNITGCKGQFECEDGKCIDKNLVCNSVADCPDSSDEKNCSRHVNVTCPGMFECKNGKCIDKNDVCNGDFNCGDGDKSDETGCKNKEGILLLRVLIGIAVFCAVLCIVIIILLCFRYCCASWKVAAAYRRLS